MHMRLHVAVLVVMGLLAWSRGAQACSCERPLTDLHEALTSARDKAQALFLGRVEGIESGYAEHGSKRILLHRVTFTVSETFKGKVSPRQVVTTYQPDGRACGYLFEQGVEYLVYAGADELEGLETSMCSRTRPATQVSVELASLRSGVLPPRPGALRRERVGCTACDEYSVAAAMACTGGRDCAATREGKVHAALRKHQPFWAYGQRDDSGQSKLYGLASNGRTFELVQRPGDAAQETCLQRVDRRWCARLSVTLDPHGGRPVVECLDPSAEERVCDETTTRSSSWGPREALPLKGCDWRFAEAPRCELDPTVTPLDSSGQATGPGLLCAPSFGNRYGCRVVPTP